MLCRDAERSHLTQSCALIPLQPQQPGTTSSLDSWHAVRGCNIQGTKLLQAWSWECFLCHRAECGHSSWKQRILSTAAWLSQGLSPRLQRDPLWALFAFAAFQRGQKKGLGHFPPQGQNPWLQPQRDWEELFQAVGRGSTNSNGFGSAGFFLNCSDRDQGDNAQQGLNYLWGTSAVTASLPRVT